MSLSSTLDELYVRFEKYPNFKFVTIPDGLPEDNPRNGDQIGKIIEGVEKVSSPLLAIWTYLAVPKLIEDGEIPFKG